VNLGMMLAVSRLVFLVEAHHVLCVRQKMYLECILILAFRELGTNFKIPNPVDIWLSRRRCATARHSIYRYRNTQQSSGELFGTAARALAVL
jgi:hypothetical protein